MLANTEDIWIPFEHVACFLTEETTTLPGRKKVFEGVIFLLDEIDILVPFETEPSRA